MDGPGGTVYSALDGPAGPVLARTIYRVTGHKREETSFHSPQGIKMMCVHVNMCVSVFLVHTRAPLQCVCAVVCIEFSVCYIIIYKHFMY